MCHFVFSASINATSLAMFPEDVLKAGRQQWTQCRLPVSPSREQLAWSTIKQTDILQTGNLLNKEAVENTSSGSQFMQGLAHFLITCAVLWQSPARSTRRGSWKTYMYQGLLNDKSKLIYIAKHTGWHCPWKRGWKVCFLLGRHSCQTIIWP